MAAWATPNSTSPAIIGAGLATISGSGSICVHTAISLRLWIVAVSRKPPPFQPKPIKRNVSSMTTFRVSPPASPAMRILVMRPPLSGKDCTVIRAV